MANPWDNDEIVAAPAAPATAQGNPWDQDPVVEEYVGGDGPGLDIEIVDSAANRRDAQKALVNEMSGAERFGVGVGKSLADNAIGAGQVLSSEYAPLLYGIPGLVTREIGRRGMRQAVDEAAQEARERDAPLMKTGAGIGGNITGNLLQILGPGVAARGTSAANALLPTTVRGNLLQGAYIGALQPASDSGERAANVGLGGLGGAGGAVLGNVAGGAIRSARNLLSRTGVTATDRAAGNVLAREATNPAAINIEESAVPGVQRTLGEASGDSGLMALENVMRARSRGAFEPIDLRNNAARVSQLQRIAGSDGDMAAAEAARDAVVDGSLQRALREGGQFEANMVAGQQAQRQAALEAASAAESENARLASLGLSGRVPVPAVPEAAGQVSQGLQGLRGMVSEIRDRTAARPSVQSAMNDVSRALGAADESVGSLYLVRKYIDDLLQGKAGADKSYARAASRELMQIKGALDDELSARAPSFPEYLNAYRSASKPINRMEVGREILKKSSGTAEDQLGNPILTPVGVARATSDLDAIAAKATDFKKAKAADILTSGDMSALRAIQDDMQRIAQRNRSAAAGSQTMERLSVGERAAVRGAASKLPWVGPLFEHFEQASNQRLNERLAYLMANPSEAQRVLAALPAADAGVLRKTLGQLALATGRASQPAATQK